MSESDGWSREGLIKALQRAAGEIDGPLTQPNYRSHDGLGLPSVTAYDRVFGSWNEAKEAAGLETYERGFFPNYRIDTSTPAEIDDDG